MQGTQLSGNRTPVGDLVAALYEAAGAVRRQGEYVASGAGQSLARWEVLYILDVVPASVAQVARRLGRTRQSVQRIADLLESEGLVVPTPNIDNKRSPLFHLTEQGSEILGSINSAGAIWNEVVSAEFGPEQLEKLTDSLRLLAELARRGIGSDGPSD